MSARIRQGGAWREENDAPSPNTARTRLTFQQIQKNERGFNRIGASRLYQLCHILDVPLSYFFDDMPPIEEADVSGLRGGVEETSAPDLMNQRETLELVRVYYRIRDSKMRDALRRMTSGMAKDAGTP